MLPRELEAVSAGTKDVQARITIITALIIKTEKYRFLTIRFFFLSVMDIARLPAALFDQADVLNPHGFLGGFRHVVDRQRGNGDGG